MPFHRCLATTSRSAVGDAAEEDAALDLERAAGGQHYRAVHARQPVNSQGGRRPRPPRRSGVTSASSGTSGCRRRQLADGEAFKTADGDGRTASPSSEELRCQVEPARQSLAAGRGRAGSVFEGSPRCLRGTRGAEVFRDRRNDGVAARGDDSVPPPATASASSAACSAGPASGRRRHGPKSGGRKSVPPERGGRGPRRARRAPSAATDASATRARRGGRRVSYSTQKFSCRKRRPRRRPKGRADGSC